MSQQLAKIVSDLPRKLRQIAEALLAARGSFVTVTRLVDVIYGDDIDGGPLGADQNVHTYVHKLKKQIEHTGWEIRSRRFDGYALAQIEPVRRQPDITALTSIIGKVEDAIAGKQEALEIAATDLARTVGPLAAAHRLAELAIETMKLADIEDAG